MTSRRDVLYYFVPSQTENGHEYPYYNYNDLEGYTAQEQAQVPTTNNDFLSYLANYQATQTRQDFTDIEPLLVRFNLLWLK